MKHLFYIVFLVFMAMSPLPASALSYSPDTVVVKTAKGNVLLRVEIADSDEERERGLQHRKHLAPKTGMLFLFPAESMVSMWMAETPISLDMIFIDSDGKISQIVANAEPESRTIINGKKPSIAVLEIGGGEAKNLGIRLGDQVQYAQFE